jgi:hypothetical protein
MATRSRKSKKGASRKSSTTTKRTKSGKAVPPPDDPLLRHEETDVDRLLLEYTPSAGVTAAAAPYEALTTPSKKKRTRRGVAAAAAAQGGAGRTVMTQLASLRVDAVETSRAMPAHDLGAPVVAATPIAPGSHHEFGPLAIAPVPGVSNWVQLGPTAIPKGQTYSAARVLVTGRVTSIAIDPSNPNIVYCGAAQGGVWKTVNAGQSWFPTSDNELSLAIGAIAVDPVNPLIVYAGTGEGNFSGDSYYGSGLLKSTNGGASWTMNATATFIGARFCRIAITPGLSTNLFAATTSGLFRSTNSGVNWTAMSGGLPAAACTDVCIDSGNTNVAYAAFWGQGIWKTVNATAASPTWTKLTTGLPASGTFTRIALGISRSSPQNVFALIANLPTSNPSTSYLVDRFVTTSNGGTSWTNVALPGGNIGTQGFYNLNVVVDLTTPNIVYLSAISIWKAVFSSGSWTITNVGAPIHPDNHAFAMHPTNHLVIYAGSDGGIYRSTNGGTSWDDSINKDLCITQFEFLAQHPTSDAVVLGGTQDNGTEQFRNDAVFYHSDDGDGGYCLIEQTPNPLNALSTYYRQTPKRSTQGGKFGSWASVTSGINMNDPALFYPPMAMDRTNSQNAALGTNHLYLTATQGTGGWTSISIPSFTGVLSAIDYVNSSLIYAGASNGNVFCFRFSGTWSVTPIHAAPLPVGAFVTDIAAVPGSPNTVIVTFGGFGIPHVWRGVVPTSGTATWTDISGSGTTGIPNIPVNALVIDPAAPTVYYIATDVAVYRSTTGGTTWTQFSQGLPNCAVFDLQLHAPTRLLRAGTHGRGMWEKKLDVPSLPAADLYFRDHAMSTGRIVPAPNGVPAAYEDPLQLVTLGAPQYIWMSTDMKVDALAGLIPTYQFPVSAVDYVVYESKLQHRNSVRGQVNRAYVQVHNRGFAPAANVTVKLLWADASAGLPPLPSDFWTMFPGNSSNTTQWHPLGTAQTIASLSNTTPAILEWDFTPPSTASNHVCLLAIMDSPADPIPAANKVFTIGTLISNEKRAALKNLTVVDPSPSTWLTIDFNAALSGVATIRVIGTGAATFGIALPKGAALPAVAAAAKRRAAPGGGGSPRLEGLAVKKASARHIERLKADLGGEADKFDTGRMLFSSGKSGSLSGIKLPKGGLRAAFLVNATEPATLTIVQEEDNQIVGGFTVVVADTKPKP